MSPATGQPHRQLCQYLFFARPACCIVLPSAMLGPTCRQGELKPEGVPVSAAQQILAAIGAATRQRLAFPLQAAALFWGVLSEGVRPSTWQRTVCDGVRISLTAIVLSSLATVAVTAVIVGVGLVFAPLDWLRPTGEWSSTGRILVLILFHQIAPLLVGIILLGRSGIEMTAEFAALLAEGKTTAPCGEEIDIFRDLVLPRAVALALAAFTLGTVFILIALLSGYAGASVTQEAQASVMGFLSKVLRVMSSADLAAVSVKFLMIGLVVAVSCSITGLDIRGHERPTSVLPRAFTRGVTSILLVTIVLSIVL